jgi:excisionase family DNA binding protein
MTVIHDPKQVLTPAEVAELFAVDPKTVTRWARRGKLHALRTMGGHRRYDATEIHRLVAAHTTTAHAH